MTRKKESCRSGCSTPIPNACDILVSKATAITNAALCRTVPVFCEKRMREIGEEFVYGA